MASANQRGPAAASRRGQGGGAAARTGSKAAGGSSRRRRLIDYPRAGKSGVRHWLPSWRLVLGTGLSGGFLLLGLVVAAYATTTIPEPSEFAQAQTTTVRYANNADGSPGAVMGTFADTKRQIIDPATIPEHVGDAVVASEDQSFFDNSGIDPVGIVRAFVNNVRGGATQGGSTITQQYVERYYNGKTTTSYVGKFQEALLAVKVSQGQDKKDILGKYLNTIYFGRSTYGIEAAARAYFDVDAKDLTVAQGALLAGIIPSPSNWDPLVNPKKAQQRWERVLNNMVTGGWLSEADRKAQVFPTTIPLKTSQTYAGPQGYLLKLVRDELINRASLTDDRINTIGLNIVTTIVQPAQAAAEAAVAGLRDGTLAKATPDPLMKVGLTSIDPKDGAVIALYGGPDYLTSARNAVTQDTAQAGSTFKPFALTAALENGISLTKKYRGSSPMLIKGWDASGKKVTNFGKGAGEQFGTIDLVEATEASVNTVYAQLNVEVGADKTRDAAIRAGITTTVLDNPGNVLGTDNVKPIDMADAYATFASGGYHNTWFIVRTATLLKDGSTYYQGAGTPQQVFKPEVMADLTYAMTQVVQGKDGTAAKWVKPLGRPIAGKTGTSSDNHSAWFVGFTPQIVTAVAFYQQAPDLKSEVGITTFGKVDQVTGGTWPAALWANYMKAVFALPQYATVVDFPPRANVNVATATSAPSAPSTPSQEQTTPAPEVPTTATVPSGLTGMTQADAEAAILNVGLVPSSSEQASATVEKGRVISASPAAGATVDAGSTVSLVVSSGPVVVPLPTGSPSANVPPAAGAVLPPPG